VKSSEAAKETDCWQASTER